ncbi:hypothetical protein Tco_0381522 [Tanacetum coccineum]
MASFDYRLNPLYAIKECSSCGALYTSDYCCSKGGLEDKILVPKTPDSSQRLPQDCVKCGNPVEGPNCQGCALWRKKLKEVWFTICHENGIYQDLLNTYESSDDDTNVVNAPREPFVVKQDPGTDMSKITRNNRKKRDSTDTEWTNVERKRKPSQKKSQIFSQLQSILVNRRHEEKKHYLSPSPIHHTVKGKDKSQLRGELVNSSDKQQDGKVRLVISKALSSSQGKDHTWRLERQRKGFALISLSKLHKSVTSKNDSMAILECPQLIQRMTTSPQ